MVAFSSARFSALVALAATVPCAFAAVGPVVNSMVLMHTNDVHAQIEQKDGFGGVSRRATKIKEIRAQNPNNLLLDAGDQFQGTLWFNIFEGKEAYTFMNMLKYQGMCFGNHEFDLTSQVTADFIKETTFPVLACNVDVSKDPALNAVKYNILPHKVYTLPNGLKVGVIGFVTEDTVNLSTPEETVTFKPISSELPKCIQRFKAENPTVKVIIGLGHAGYQEEIQIAKSNPDLDIVIGGHSHTFLYTGTPPSKEVVEGPYPTVVDQAGGRKTLVVTAYTNGKYLGKLDVGFDANGDVASYSGNPILIDNNIIADPAVEAEVLKYQAQVDEIKLQEVGATLLPLAGGSSNCRNQECTMGNVLADAYVRYFFKNLHKTRRRVPNTPPLYCFFNGGGVRTSLPAGTITLGDILAVVPFGNTMVLVPVPGTVLKKALEHGVSADYDAATGMLVTNGRFPQLSGVQFTFDPKRPVGSRVLEIRVADPTGTQTKFKPYSPTATYPMIMTTFTAGGGDGYDMFKPLQAINYDVLDSDPIVEYFQEINPLWNIGGTRIFQYTPPVNPPVTITSTVTSTVTTTKTMFPTPTNPPTPPPGTKCTGKPNAGAYADTTACNNLPVGANCPVKCAANAQPSFPQFGSTLFTCVYKNGVAQYQGQAPMCVPKPVRCMSPWGAISAGGRAFVAQCTASYCAATSSSGRRCSGMWINCAAYGGKWSVQCNY